MTTSRKPCPQKKGEQVTTTSNNLPDSFLRHAAVCSSQYDGTCRSLSQALLDARATIAKLEQQVARLTEAIEKHHMDCEENQEDRELWSVLHAPQPTEQRDGPAWGSPDDDDPINRHFKVSR